MLFERSLNGSHATQLLLQEGFRVPVGFVERLNGILEVMKLTELMGNTGEDKGHRAPDRLFAIGNDAFDRDLEGFQKPLDAPLAKR